MLQKCCCTCLWSEGTFRAKMDGSIDQWNLAINGFCEKGCFHITIKRNEICKRKCEIAKIIINFSIFENIFLLFKQPRGQKPEMPKIENFLSTAKVQERRKIQWRRQIIATGKIYNTDLCLFLCRQWIHVLDTRSPFPFTKLADYTASHSYG